MDQRIALFSSVVLAVFPAAAACSSAPPEAASTATVEGVYTASEGAEAALGFQTAVFYGDGHYVTMPPGCERIACYHGGTYTLAAARDSLRLNDLDGSSRAYAIAAAPTAPAEPNAPVGDGGLLPQATDLVSGGGVTLVGAETSLVPGAPRVLADGREIRLLTHEDTVLVAGRISHTNCDVPADAKAAAKAVDPNVKLTPTEEKCWCRHVEGFREQYNAAGARQLTQLLCFNSADGGLTAPQNARGGVVPPGAQFVLSCFLSAGKSSPKCANR